MQPGLGYGPGSGGGATGAGPGARPSRRGLLRRSVELSMSLHASARTAVACMGAAEGPRRELTERFPTLHPSHSGQPEGQAWPSPSPAARSCATGPLLNSQGVHTCIRKCSVVEWIVWDICLIL